MKKILAITICVMLLLCACGRKVPSGTEGDTEAIIETTSTNTKEDTSGATMENTSTAPSEMNTLEKAQSCVDKPVEELIALIGEPAMREYAPSCMGDGEDGNLFYGDFTVYTYRDEEGEIVTYVE